MTKPEPRVVEPDATDISVEEARRNIVLQRADHGGHHHFHTPITDPVWLPADQDAHMKPDDAVLGFVDGDDAYAVPWWIMKNHHVANLEFASGPVMMVLCEACAGATAFDPRVDGQRFTFNVDGKYNATHILKDHQTGSHWTPFNGDAVRGPMAGSRMQHLPLQQCRWSEWKQIYPATRVLDGTGESREGHGSQFPTPSTRGPVPFARRTQHHRDDRLPHQDLVFGIELDGQARAYPLKRLHRFGTVVHDRLADRDIVVFSSPRTWLGVAFVAELDGEALRFRPAAEPFQFEDTATGSRWDSRGLCVAGEHAGRQLHYVPCRVEKWFGWCTSHPGTEIWHPG